MFVTASAFADTLPSDALFKYVLGQLVAPGEVTGQTITPTAAGTSVATTIAYEGGKSLTITADLLKAGNTGEAWITFPQNLGSQSIPKINLAGAAVKIDLTGYLSDINSEWDILPRNQDWTRDFSGLNDTLKQTVQTFIENNYSEAIKEFNELTDNGDFVHSMNAFLKKAGYDYNWETLNFADLLNLSEIASIEIETGIPGDDGISKFFIYDVNGGAAPGWSVDFTEMKVTHAATATPEPATLAVFGLGVAGLAVLRRRKK